MQTDSFDILIVEGVDGQQVALADYLHSNGYRVERLTTCSMHPFALHERNPQLVLLDLSALGGSTPAEQLTSLVRLTGQTPLPVILLAPDSDLEFELLDVYDFLAEPIDLYRLQVDIERLITSPRLQPKGVLLESELETFRAFIDKHSGLHFSQRNNRILEHGLHRRMCAVGVESFSAYHDYLIRHSESRNELKKLLTLLTIGETSFFRYSNQREAFLNYLIPDLIAQRRQSKTLRIWSAGCSTGEEPYGIAMLLAEHFPELAGWTVQILATDINKRSLRAAREGVYRKRAVRLVEKKYQERYFESVDDLYVVKDEVKKAVRFEYLNLKEETFPSKGNATAGLDLIFCRNVMIYFETETTRQIVDRFADCLKPGGYLLLGHSETLQKISERFEGLHHERAFFYRLTSQNNAVARPVAALLPSSAPPVIRADASAALPAESPLSVSDKTRRQKGVLAEQFFNAARADFNREDYVAAEDGYSAVLKLQPDHLGALVGKGLSSANRGDYDLARELCTLAEKTDDLCPDIYFLRGMISDMESRPVDAVAEYQKVLWLDPCFIMAHYALSRLNRQSGDLSASRRALLNAIRCLEKISPSTRVHLSGGMTREVFLELCRNDLDSFAD